MLFEKRFWPGIADGTVTLTFRRWKSRQVVPGRPYRTAGGIVDVTSVTVVELESITDAEARAAGFASAGDLVADLRGDPGLPVYRVEFTRAAGPDLRAELAADADLTPEAVADITKRLDRLDKASSYGAWTRETLRLIAEHPQRRARDLADMVGRERAPFKLDVRKLKNLGLTQSFEVGYRLSPRGRAYLEQTD